MNTGPLKTLIIISKIYFSSHGATVQIEPRSPYIHNIIYVSGKMEVQALNHNYIYTN